MEHLRRSAGFGRARLNTSLAIRSGSQKPAAGAGERLASPRIMWPCRSLPFGTSRAGSTGPSLPPAGAVSLSPEVTWLSDAGLRSASLEESSLPQLKARSPVQGAKGGKGPDRCGRGMELAAPGKRLSSWAIEEESNMPVLLLWAVPAVIVVGGVGYYLVRAVH